MVASDLTSIINRVQHMAYPDYDVLAEKVQDYLNDGVRDQFATEGVRFNTPWHPLKPDYALWKLKHGYVEGILVLTGHMRAAACNGNAVADRTLFGARITYGTGHHWLIPIHQYGVVPWLPSRPILHVTPQDILAIRQFIGEIILST